MPMSPLPIDPLLPELLDALRASRAGVLVAPPGAGKTTRVPPALLRSGLLDPSHPSVLMLQPRRVAARAAAARIAEENGWAVGREVGYQVRFERRIGPETRLRVATEGVLNRQLLADPFLEGVGAVVLDEFHERSLHTDLALALLREVRESVREDLILVVMSATLDADPVARYLGGCPVLRAEGRSFPVEVEYLPPSDARSPIQDRVRRAAEHAIATGPRDGGGDLLVFLPGMEEIRRSSRELEPLARREGLLVLPLHGSLPAEDQDRAIRPADRRKLILATNVAETSLTIEGVTTVIDTGLARFASHDPSRGLDRLELGKISRASAAQRAGRAGRTGPGRCLRLWSERDDRGRPEFDEPEIRRVDLCETVLALHAWGQADPARFGWFEPPPAASLAGAERLLEMLGALEGGRITGLGRQLLALPTHPRLGRLLVEAARLGRLREGAAMAALLAEKDLAAVERPGPAPGPRRPASHGRSDLLDRLDRLEEAERARFAPGLRASGIDPAAARRAAQARDELLRIGRRLEVPAGPAGHEPGDEDPEDDLLRLPLAAYPDRVCRRRPGDAGAGVMVGGRGVRLEPESVVREAELFLALDLRDDRRGGTREARVRIASEIRADWLEAMFPGAVRLERTVRFDESRGRAIAALAVLYRDLVLLEETHGAVSAEEASSALASTLAERAEAFVREDEAAASLLDRLEFLRRAAPEGDWPAFGPDDLAEVVADACIGRRTVDEVRRVPKAPLLLGRLTHALRRALDENAPEALQVPTGNRIRLAYEPGRPPVLAVRLQELFGLADTPRLAGGRVPVLLHLLGPNYRPVQVTDDLRSFWTTTYHQVRKDLRARYPKHSWPEDPWTARPEAKGGRRRT
jgi:ATP-dependent helicase HrpB